jgi:septal ring-binding cell division protein DamX
VVVPEPPKAPASQLSTGQLKRYSGYHPGNHRLLRERLEATRATLEAAPNTSFGIELFFTENSDAGRTERFLVRARELVPLSEVYVIPIAAGSRYFLRVVYGSYPDRETAVAATRQLPRKYQDAFQLVVRSFGELRASI